MLVPAIRAALAAHADPVRAPQMQRYMKSQMPFLGVAATPLRAALRPLFTSHLLPDADTWRSAVLELWRTATFREERYAAIELSGVERYRPWQDLDVLPMYRELIVTGAWWDYVDVIASHRIGYLLEQFSLKMNRTMRAWSRHEDHWLRRTSILCQLRRKEQTDLELLYACIEPSLGESDFFLRKAIGWALRQHAWTDPQEVKRYVRAHDSELSGLSKREALKNL